MSIVRRNLMEIENYTLCCGNQACKTMPGTLFNGNQFVCGKCGWISSFPGSFIKQYKVKWRIK